MYNMYKLEVTKKNITVEREGSPYSIGDIFVDEKNKAYMLVSPSTNFVCLVQISDGNRWVDALVVNDPREITSEEFKRIVSSLTLTKVKRADFNFSL